MRSLVPAILSISTLLCSFDEGTAQAPDVPAATTAAEGANSDGTLPRTIPGNNNSTADPQRYQLLLERVSSLETQVDRLRGRTDAHDAAIQGVLTRVAEIGDAIRQNQEAIRRNQDAITQNQDAIQSMNSRVTDLSSQVDGHNGRITQLTLQVDDNHSQLRDIVKQDSQGGYYLDVLGNMQKAEFRQDFRRVVTESGAMQGRLWIHNPQPVDHIIYINGARWRALAGWSYVWVPYGSISVTHWGGISPPVKTAREWSFNDQNRVYEITYDLGSPWR